MREGFSQVFRPGLLYRSTGVVLAGLVAEAQVQYTLFDDTAKIERMGKVYSAVDKISEKYGKHTIQHGSSLPTIMTHFWG